MPEWRGRTVTGPSPAECCFWRAGGGVGGRACASLTLPGRVTFRVAISTDPDPQGSSRVVILTHPYTTAACAALAARATVGRAARSCCRRHGN